MADDSSRQTTKVWPLPKLHFQVNWDSAVMSFEEVSGLDVQAQPIEYRHGATPVFAAIKMPGLKKVGNVTLKKGVFRSGNKFWNWFNQLRLNASNRKPVTISLLDEGGRPTRVWTLNNAWPAKVSGADLNAEGNEVAIETLEIEHEGLSIANA